jgi:integrase
MKPILVPGKKYTPWKVHFPGGKRRFFKTEEDAAQAIKDFTKGKAKVILGKRQVDEVLYCQSLLGEATLLSAVRFFLEHHNVVDGTATLADACQRYWAVVNKETASPYYTTKVRQHLAKLRSVLGDSTLLTAVGPETYQKFIGGLPTLPQKHAHHRTCRGLFRHAVATHSMAKNPTERWAPADLPDKRPVYLEVEATRLLLDWTWLNCPRLIPAFVLQLFCGIRSAELSRAPTAHKRPLDWSDINFETRKIDVAAVVSKNKHRRIIDWTHDALWVWLAPFRKTSGPVCCPNYDHLKSQKIKECQAELGLDGIDLGFDQNAFRHSFASYAVAYLQSADRVSILMGHRGSAMLFQHYREYVSQVAAQEFFSITPAAPLLLKLVHAHYLLNPTSPLWGSPSASDSDAG